MTPDFTSLDRPAVLTFLFHPRRDAGGPLRKPIEEATEFPGVADALVPVEDGIVVGARFHLADRRNATLLFFHGNGEIAADYDDLGPVYNRTGLNFIAADYRGYGRSTGRPTVASMMRDSLAVFRFVREWLAANRFSGPLIVMGRSLGSASALEIADVQPAEISGLIIESGFARAAPLLQRLGVDPQAIGFREDQCFRHLEKISRFEKPVLVIHAQFDQIIPFPDGQALFDTCPAAHKRLLQIPAAGHNDILLHGLEEYLSGIRSLADAILSGHAG
jgi:hypothetical protein